MVNIYDMKLHEKVTLDNIDILRVPGGWIYTISLQTWSEHDGYTYTSVFVPFDNDCGNEGLLDGILLKFMGSECEVRNTIS